MPELTSIGYMPIVQAPAHHLDTLHTVILRCRCIARKLGQHHAVLTVDEALYCKLMERKWAKPEYPDFLVVRLGGLHTSLKFVQVIGKHVQSSGLEKAWIDSNCLGPKTSEHVFSGKSYAKEIRIHNRLYKQCGGYSLQNYSVSSETVIKIWKKQIRYKLSSYDTNDLFTILDNANEF